MSLHVKVRTFSLSTACVLFLWGVAQAAPRAEVVIGATAPELEQFAASELCGYLVKLFGIQTHPVRSVTPSAEMIFLVGSPQTNAAVKQATGRRRFRQSLTRGLCCGGRSMKGVRLSSWAEAVLARRFGRCYELVERWGVRYLTDRDALPEKVGDFKLPDLEVVMEPVFRIRAHPTIQDLVASGEAWGIADFRRLIDQLAKMKFTRINIYTFGWQPFLHWEYGG